MPPIATVQVGDPDPNREPNNPFYVEAKALEAAKDLAGLRALDTRLKEAGYSATGTVRTFIANALSEL